ncbi:MAG: LysR family transcriptional regulator [Eubacterium sp.]|nr:LysR family transcriptional regulator [Eubacterium sp.]
MNTTQIKYFLAAARTLNFTEAARQLYISQPALSKQITAIENELNMMLFVRSQKKVRLTPAGAVLLKELPKFEEHYDNILHKAKVANEGVSGELSIGLLEGQMVGDTFTEVYGLFAKQYPNISVRLLRNSFSGLRKALEDGSIDLAITLEFDIAGVPNIQYEKLEVCPAIAAVAKTHPVAAKKVTSWADLKDYTIIAVTEEDCFASDKMIIEDCKRAGFTPMLKYAPTLETAMLWTEAGMGICVVNSMNNLTQNPNIKMLSDMPCKNTISVIAWKQENINPAIALFTNFYNAHGDTAR